MKTKEVWIAWWAACYGGQGERECVTEAEADYWVHLWSNCGGRVALKFKRRVRTGERSRRADARLIAAAPDLFAACKAALNERIKAFVDPADDALCLNLSAAIAKAKG